MFANERQSAILQIVNSKGSATVGELTQLLSVSLETIRRDLIFLERQNCLQRVHGGVIALPQMKETARLPQRLKEKQEEKRALSMIAMSFIQENDVIAIDAGSTAIEFSEALRIRFHKLTIVTHSLDVFNIVRNENGFNTILCGGQFDREENAFYGIFAREAISQFHVSKAFIFPDAVSLKNGVAGFNPNLAQIQRLCLKASDTAFILADSSKFEKNAFLKLCDVDSKNVFITDPGLPAEIYDLYQSNKIQIHKEEGK